jgi:hypothetical protein
MTATITGGMRQWSCSIDFALFTLQIKVFVQRIKDTVGIRYCVPKNKQDQDLLQTSNGVGVIISRQMLSLMQDKSFTKSSQAAAFLGLIPIKKSERGLHPTVGWR